MLTCLWYWWPASKRWATLLALACCVLASLSLGACASSQTTLQTCTACGPPVDWELQPGQAVATGAASTFALKWVEVTPQQLRFYYVWLSTPHNQLQAAASVSYPTNTSVVSSPPTSVQVLGQIGDYAVGVIHVDWAENVQQLIGLELTAVSASGVHVSTWHLTPLEQLHPDRLYHTGGGQMTMGVPPNEEGLPEAVWLEVVEGAHLVSYVKIVIPGQPVADRSYVFVNSDDPVTVTVISKAEYLSIAGANFTP